MKKVMFVCKKNSRRSQMAEGWLRKLAEGKIEVTSAGLEASQVDPLAIRVMEEVGIDISHHISKPLTDFSATYYDVVISLCGCGVNLPEEWVLREVFADWQLEDPEGDEISKYRHVRDQVKQKVMELLKQLQLI